MKNDRRYLVSILYMMLGVVLFVLGVTGKVDSFWSGMGGGLMGVGIAQFIRFRRFRKDEEYREEVEREENDERNVFLRNKAWAWTGYLLVLILAVASIVLKILGQELLSIAAGIVVALMVVLYWISYCILARKY